MGKFPDIFMPHFVLDPAPGPGNQLSKIKHFACLARRSCIPKPLEAPARVLGVIFSLEAGSLQAQIRMRE